MFGPEGFKHKQSITDPWPKEAVNPVWSLSLHKHKVSTARLFCSAIGEDDDGCQVRSETGCSQLQLSSFIYNQLLLFQLHSVCISFTYNQIAFSFY